MDDLKWMIAREIPHLRRYALALVRDHDVADDLVQDCLERALNKSNLWLRKGSIRSWLFRVLYNVHLNNQKSLRRWHMVGSGSDIDMRRVEPSRQEQYVECRDIAEALDMLPADQRAAILMIGLNGFAYEEAAWILGIPVGTLRSRLSRGREMLRSLMDSAGQRYGRLRRVK